MSNEAVGLDICPNCGRPIDRCSCACHTCGEVDGCECAIGPGVATGG